MDIVETKVSTASKAKFDYDHDTLGRRKNVVQTGEIFSRYTSAALSTRFGYNDRSELTSATTVTGTNPDATTGLVPGRDLGFTFDNIGNRLTSSVDGQQTGYTHNNLNQIQRRTIPGLIDVSGFAPSAAAVTVNGSGSGVSRQGDFFQKAWSVTNTSSPVWQSFAIESSYGGSETRNGFLSQNRTSGDEFTYDLDGNLTQDDRWAYTWDAENRLISMQTAAAVIPSADRRRMEFTYDYLGRRVRKLVRGDFASGALTAGIQSLAALGWDKAREFTDDMGGKVAAAEPNRLKYDSTGSLRTDGATLIEKGPSFFGDTADKLLSGADRLLQGAGMAKQGSELHWYDAAVARWPDWEPHRGIRQSGVQGA